jgi:hypothetical protein
MPGGWGDHLWGPDPWGGTGLESPILTGFMLLVDDEATDERLGPPQCHSADRPIGENTPPGHVLCQYFPGFMCVEDLDPERGGTGDWHRLLAVIWDFLYGSDLMTGMHDDVASFICLNDILNVPASFLDAWLLKLGFNLKIPLTDKEKRKVLSFLVAYYKSKGTKESIKSALRILLGIPVEIYDLRSPTFNWFELGWPASSTLSAVDDTSTFVEVANPEQFSQGKMLTIIDKSGGNLFFEDTEILGVVSNRVLFAAQVIGGTIPAGADVFSTLLRNHLDDGSETIGESILGPNFFDPTDPSIYTFAVDVQRTVATVTDIEDGDDSVELSSVDFVVVGSRVRIVDTVVPLNAAVIVDIVTVDPVTKVVTFEPLALDETIELGATAINLFNAEQIALIGEIVIFGKPSHTHHVITRDIATELAEVG